MGPKILVADDARFMRNVIKKALLAGGYDNIVEAANGAEVLAKYKEHMPVLVILDITMPECSGLDVLKDILSIDEKAKVVMCSAIGQNSVIAQAVDAGAKDFITKPFETEDFLKLVRRYI